MVRGLRLLLILAGAVSGAQAGAQVGFCAAHDGASVIDSGGVSIGRIAPAIVRDSIFNDFGAYGPRSTGSVWNPIGRNGGRFGLGSARNPAAVSPPRLIKNGRIVGVLTTNRAIMDAVSPTTPGAVCFHYFPDG